ncbi:olfactory receptor 8D1-like [Spea bombifrons]|uniref:olfactory receptor 8D1-like n=1 Tax=Spea bombifrons TaxID=233779 RepID=UPI00234B4CED|nr:olfactory receptor 8D1-like [Spea bombifrons]
MELNNQTMVTYFIIKGISDAPELQLPIFLLVLLIYLITLGGNLTILLLVCLDRHLRTPMYFFLSNLSILDMCSVTVTLHKVLIIFITKDNTVSYSPCMTQMYFFGSLICDELLLLTAMSYDRYVAICKPLHYHTSMNGRVCASLAIACWLFGFVEVIPYIELLVGFSCYRSNIINHFFCDLVPLMKLSCSDTYLLEVLSLTEGLLLITIVPFMFTFISYVFIIMTIVRIRTSSGRLKAFYTCSSHLTVVVLLYGILLSQYLRPVSTNTSDSNRFFSLFNTAVVPMLNPLIYSLKNKDVKRALARRLGCYRTTR